MDSLTSTLSLLGPMRGVRTVVICDSRGEELMEKIAEYTLLNFVVKTFKCAPLYDSVLRARPSILRLKPKYIIIMSGICNITRLEKSGGVRRTYLRHYNPDIALHYYSMEMAAAEHQIGLMENEGGFSTTLIFAPLIGCSLTQYNSITYDDWRDLEIQNFLNETIIRINQHIYQINITNQILIPHISNQVHHNEHSGIKTHRYQRLHSDGLHFCDDNRAFVAKKLIDCITKNFYGHL